MARAPRLPLRRSLSALAIMLQVVPGVAHFAPVLDERPAALALPQMPEDLRAQAQPDAPPREGAGGKRMGEAIGHPAVAVAVPVAVPVPVPVAAPAAPWYEQRGHEALARLTYDWQRLGWTVVFEPGRTGYLGMAYPDQRRIVIWVRDEQTVEHVASVVAHELGHAVDLTYNTPERRQQWLELRGLAASGPWFGCGGCTDFATPAGDFAEVFSYWQTGTDYQSELGAYPAPDTLTELTVLFDPAP